MSLSINMIDAMIGAGCTADQIAAVVKTDIAEREAVVTAKREKDAARQRKCRENKAVSRDVTVTGCDKQLKNTPDKSFPQTPFKINPKNIPPISPQFDQKFVEVWNDQASVAGMTRAMPLNSQRRGKLKRRVSEFGEDGMLKAVEKLSKSPFHCGDNDRSWKADIGWLLKSSENVTKALELDLRKASGEGGSFLGSFQKRQGNAR